MRTHLFITAVLAASLSGKALASPDKTVTPHVPSTGTTPTKPSADGYVFYTVEFTDGSTKSVKVKVPAGTKDDAKKRELIQKGFQDSGFTASETTGGGVSVVSAGPGGKTVKG